MQGVLDEHGLPAIAAGRNSFWQFLFMAQEPRNQVDLMRSDMASARKLDMEFLRRGCYVLPGVRRFVSAVNTEADKTMTLEALDGACRVLKT